MKTTIIVDSWDIEKYPFANGEEKKKRKKRSYNPFMEQQIRNKRKTGKVQGHKGDQCKCNVFFFNYASIYSHEYSFFDDVLFPFLFA